MSLRGMKQWKKFFHQSASSFLLSNNFFFSFPLGKSGNLIYNDDDESRLLSASKILQREFSSSNFFHSTADSFSSFSSLSQPITFSSFGNFPESNLYLLASVSAIIILFLEEEKLGVLRSDCVNSVKSKNEKSHKERWIMNVFPFSTSYWLLPHFIIRPGGVWFQPFGFPIFHAASSSKRLRTV